MLVHFSAISSTLNALNMTELNDAPYFPLIATPESHMRKTERNSGQFQATITKDFKVGPAAEVLICDL